MAKRKTMRAGRPSRASVKARRRALVVIRDAPPERPHDKAALGITRGKWYRVLTSRPFAGDGSEACAAHARFLADQRFAGAGALCEMLRITRRQLLEATEGLPFRVDFGVDKRGRQLAAFFERPLLAWALGQTAVAA